MANAVAKLTKTQIGASHEDRAVQYLGDIETQANLAIQKANAIPAASRNRLDAARLYQRNSKANFERLHKRRLHIENLLAAPPPKLGILDRLAGAKPVRQNEAALEKELAKLQADLREADKQCRAADAGVVLAERELAAAEAQRSKAAAEKIRNAEDALAAIVMARRMVVRMPYLIYVGPSFRLDLGDKFEKRRRRSTPGNPFATDIWGLPLNFGGR